MVTVVNYGTYSYYYMLAYVYRLPQIKPGNKERPFPLSFLDQVLKRVAGHEYYCFLYGYFDYYQIEIILVDQEKITFTYPFSTFAFQRMLFGQCNAPTNFQQCMLSIFGDMVEDYL